MREMRDKKERFEGRRREQYVRSYNVKEKGKGRQCEEKVMEKEREKGAE